MIRKIVDKHQSPDFTKVWNSMIDLDKMLTPLEVAKILKIHVSTVRVLYRDGILDYCRLGHRTVRIYPQSVRDYLQNIQTSRPKSIKEYSVTKTDFSKLPPAGINMVGGTKC